MSFTLVLPPDMSPLMSQILDFSKRNDSGIVENFTNNGGNMEINIGGDITALFQVNDIVNVCNDQRLTSNYKYLYPDWFVGQYTITASSYSAGYSHITINRPYTESIGQGSNTWLNNMTKRPNYKVEVRVKNSAGALLIPETFFAYPSRGGRTIIDVREIVKTYLTDPTIPIFAENQATDDSFIGVGYKVDVKEVWEGSSNAWSSGATVYATLSRASYPISQANNPNEIYVASSGEGVRLPLASFNVLGSNGSSPLFNATRPGGSWQNWAHDSVKGMYVSGNSNYLVWPLPDSMKCGIGGVARLLAGMAIDIVTTGGGSGAPTYTFNFAYADASYNLGTTYTGGQTFESNVFGSNNWDRIVFWISGWSGSGERYVQTSQLTTNNMFKVATKMDRMRAWHNYPFLWSVFNNGQTLSGNMRLLNAQLSTIQDVVISSMVNKANVMLLGRGTMDNPNITMMEWSCSRQFNMYVDVVAPCKNPVMLISRNQYGGILQWLFEGRQVVNYSIEKGMQSKRMKLIADRLTLAQWEALNDFFTPMETYNKVNTDRTVYASGTVSTEDRAVYVLDQSDPTLSYGGNLTRVEVINSSPQMLTDNGMHVFEMTIELPSL